MDNPLATEIEIAYLAGLIDGEGTITLERSGNRRLNGMMGLSPKIIVANSDMAIIEQTFKTFARLGVKAHIKRQERGKYRTMYWVTIQGLAKCRKVLPFIIPHLRGKVAQAMILVKFIDYRGDSNGAKGKTYGDYELRLVDQIRALNHRGASETEDYGLRGKYQRQVTVQSDVKASGDIELRPVHRQARQPVETPGN